MLVFARREGEAFFIGDDVEITIERIDSNQVKVSVRAPKEIKIRRKEIPEITKEEKVS